MNMMKQLKATLSLALVLAMTITSAIAQMESQWFALVPVKEQRAVNVFVDLDEVAAVTLSLKAEDGREIWKRTFQTASLSRSIYLPQLADGHYELRARTATRYTAYGLALKGERVLLRPRATVHAQSPTVAVIGREIIVDVAGVDADDPVEVEIFDHLGRSLLQQTLQAGHERAIRYDLRDLPRGNYRLMFVVNDHVFERSVHLR